MKSRPKSVTVIGWILIVIAIMSAISTLMTMKDPMVIDLMSRSPIPIPVQYVMIALGVVVTFVGGVAIIQGYNWGRMLYVIWSILGFCITFATSPMKAAAVPGVVVFFVIAFFLFRPKANDFFRSIKVEAVADGT